MMDKGGRGGAERQMDGRLTRMMRSRPERKRSEWKLYAECSCPRGMFS